MEAAMKTIAAGQFKAKCLALLDEVARTRESLLVTKHGKPVAQVVPLPSGTYDLPANPLKGSIIYDRNIVDPVDADWDADR